MSDKQPTPQNPAQLLIDFCQANNIDLAIVAVSTRTGETLNNPAAVIDPNWRLQIVPVRKQQQAEVDGNT